MAGLDVALNILSSGSVGLTQTRFQELQLSLAKMELETKRDTMREEVLMRKEQRQRENTLYALDTSEKYLKEEKFNAANSVISNLVGILPNFELDMSMKQIKKQLKDKVPNELLQNKIASIVFNYYSESEASQLAAVESATNLSEYINSEYSVSKSTAAATPGLNRLIKAGLIDKPRLPDNKTPNPNFEASVLPYSLLSKTKDIKRNIAQERAEIGAGDYTIQEDILLPTQMEAAFEALAVGTFDQAGFDKALDNLGGVIDGETIQFAEGSAAEAKNEYSSAINRRKELQKQKSNLEGLIEEGFTGQTSAGLTILNEQIAEQQEEYITKLNNLRKANRKEYDANLEADAKQHLAGSGLRETAENIEAMKKRLEKIRTSPITLAVEDAPGF
tara:strand:+ start:706 stop:1875 length:1170 start_codon:yes stop_codon:yes gene_type:complete